MNTLTANPLPPAHGGCPFHLYRHLACLVRAVAELIDAVRRAPECAGLKILVGGFPFKVAPDFWRDVGADGSARDGHDALILANQLCGEVVAA